MIQSSVATESYALAMCFAVGAITGEKADVAPANVVQRGGGVTRNTLLPLPNQYPLPYLEA